MPTAERLQSVLKKGCVPWPPGADIRKLSGKALMAWEALIPGERLAISRHNPFKNERNKAIRALHRQGLTIRILAEISGVPRTTVARLIAAGNKEERE